MFQVGDVVVIEALAGEIEAVVVAIEGSIVKVRFSVSPAAWYAFDADDPIYPVRKKN